MLSKKGKRQQQQQKADMRSRFSATRGTHAGMFGCKQFVMPNKIENKFYFIFFIFFKASSKRVSQPTGGAYIS